MKAEKQRLIVGITGGSGSILGIRLLQTLQKSDIETHLVLSPNARITLEIETDWKAEQVMALAHVNHPHNHMAASIASGSYTTMGMVIIPCSIKTLSAVANSYAAELLTRAADVTLKEGRPLVLVVRETPLHRGHIRLLDQVSEAGAIIYPPVPAFYARPQSVDDLVENFVGRVLARFGIESGSYHHWQGVEQ